LIPAEVGKLPNLQRIDLCHCDGSLALKLPMNVPMPELNTLGIEGGIHWNEESIGSMISWAAKVAPNLDAFAMCGHDRETAMLFIEALASCPETQTNLAYLHVINCDIEDEDADRILGAFPSLKIVCLCRNKIDRFPIVEGPTKTVTTVTSTSTTAAAGANQQQQATAAAPLPALRTLNLSDNPVFLNLADSKSADHAAAIHLLERLKKLRWLGHSKDTCKPTAEIEYLMKINEYGRSLVEREGESSQMPIHLGLWPEILERAYRRSDAIPPGPSVKDPTPVFYLLKEGPLFSYDREMVAHPPRKSRWMKNLCKKFLKALQESDGDTAFALGVATIFACAAVASSYNSTEPIHTFTLPMDNE